jgi:hypothetical protein
MLYKLWAQDIGPRFMNVGAKVLISSEAASEWRRQRERVSSPEAA